jgi:hypothetical protein
MQTDFLSVEPASESKQWKWTDYNLKRIADVKKVVYDLERYWPVMARKVYYDVRSLPGFNDAPHWKSQSKKKSLNGLPLKNIDAAVGGLLKWSRLYCEDQQFSLEEAKADPIAIPMYAINDDGRQVGGKVGFSSTSQFFNQQIKDVFNGYKACLAQNQERYLEVWIEKKGLFHVVDPISKRFCRRTLAVRGYPSVTVLNDFANRAWNQKNPTILYFGDLDIDGVQIPETFLRSLRDEHGLYEVEVIRCGLNPNQSENLIASDIPLKGSKAEKRAFKRNYGGKAYEIDALPMPDFEQLVYDSIAEYTDMEILEADNKAGNKDKTKFDTLQVKLEEFATIEAKGAGLLF